MAGSVRSTVAEKEPWPFSVERNKRPLTGTVAR